MQGIKRYDVKKKSSKNLKLIYLLRLSGRYISYIIHVYIYVERETGKKSDEITHRFRIAACMVLVSTTADTEQRGLSPYCADR
jgi:hypothetical protein